MDRYTSQEIVRVIDHSQWAFAPSIEFALDCESPGRRNGIASPAFRGERLSVAGRHRQDMCYHTPVINKEEHLAGEVYFDVAWTSLARCWSACIPQGFDIIGGECSCSFTPLDFLERDQGLARSGVESSVHWSGPITEIRKLLLRITDFCSFENGSRLGSAGSFAGSLSARRNRY